MQLVAGVPCSWGCITVFLHLFSLLLQTAASNDVAANCGKTAGAEAACVSMLQTGRSRRPVAPRLPDGAHFEAPDNDANVSTYMVDLDESADMAEIQSAARTGANVSNWTLLAGFEVAGFWSSTARAHIYSKNGSCAVTFHGGEESLEWAEKLKVFGEVDACGATINKGLWHEAEQLIGHSSWEETFLPVLTGSQCQTVYALGSGIGGAVASLVAACANRGELSHLSGSAVSGLHFAKLYTYGAPAVSRTALTNPLSSDGCWAGARYFIVDEWTYDPIPAVCFPWGFVHPAVQPVEVSLELKAWPCTSPQASLEPTELYRNVSLGKFGLYTVPKTPNAATHNESEYLERIVGLLGMMAESEAA
mmetsp:Transcript_50144/g.119369  ORF Transcript_50144/g.119369 Transcript_50144/m.119369 type:complete len:363 (-) Transcript_50144:167-1255(-)